MRGRVALFVLLAGCGLFPSLDGLSGDAGADASLDAPADARADGSADAASDATPADAGSAYRAAVLADSPVGYWRFGGNTTTVADELGQHPGTALANVTFGEPGAIVGDPDTAARFVDRSGWIDVPGPFLFTGKVPYTVEAWSKPDAITDYSPILSADGPPNLSPRYGYSFYYDLDGTIVFGRYDYDAGGKYLAASSSAPSISAWHHLVTTVDGTTMTIYVDAVVVDSQPAGNAAATGDDFVIGADSNGTGVRFQGLLDEVAVYDHVLDATAIKHHYDVGMGK